MSQDKQVPALSIQNVMSTMSPKVIQGFQNRLAKKLEKLVPQVLNNYPEYNSEQVRCVSHKWSGNTEDNYESVTFKHEWAEGEVTVRPEDLYQSALAFWLMVNAGMFCFFDMERFDFFDPGDWDAEVTDAFMTVHFGGF